MGQTCRDVEHIVVDGASTDCTLGILGEYRGSLATVISEADNGIYDALNKGIQQATGDVIGILHGDDFFASANTLAKVCSIFTTQMWNPVMGIWFMSRMKVTSTGAGLKVLRKDFKVVRYWKSGGYDPQKFYWGWMPPHPTFFVRREVYEKYGLFNLKLGTAADYELMLRFLLKHKISCVLYSGSACQDAGWRGE